MTLFDNGTRCKAPAQRHGHGRGDDQRPRKPFA